MSAGLRRRIRHSRRALVLGGPLWLGLAGPARAESPTDFAIDVLATISTWMLAHAHGILASAYDRAPVLVAVLAAMLILPVTALALLLVQSMRLAAAQAPRPSRVAAHRSRPTPAGPTARLICPGGVELLLPPESSTISVGRHDRADIRLAFPAVHRRHAAIHRRTDGTYVIADLSGPAGNGVCVNGQRVAEAALADGDRIDLGDVALRFVVASPQTVAPPATRLESSHA